MSPDMVLYGVIWPLIVCCLLPLLPSADTPRVTQRPGRNPAADAQTRPGAPR